ncbi:MAG TPA: hypothetical protein VEF34_03700 [Syntrophobacteraceae bacterium]|nr:hypothetical protein [Syntrophobacteraceae bacterium]
MTIQKSFFRRVWRCVCIALAVTIFGIVLLTAVAVEEVLYYLCNPFGNGHGPGEYYKYDYEYDCRTTGTKEGNFEAVVEWECWWYSSYPQVTTVKLRSRWKGDTLDTATILVYNPTDAYDQATGIYGIPFVHNPDIVWLNPNELHIAVRQVKHIISQVTEAQGVKVTYSIGSVDRP